MDWTKYNKIPEEFATAREIGLAAATLGAMVRKGYVEATNTSPKQYRRVPNKMIDIIRLCEENKDNYDTYFSLRKPNCDYGMLCSIDNDIIIDCWGNKYDVTDVYEIDFFNKVIEI